jgi:hypothetical protein
MSEALINLLNQDEGKASMPNEGSQHAPAYSSSIHRELNKVNFPEFWGATYGLSIEAWLENMVMCFTFIDYTSKMKVCVMLFQLKGSDSLWWKTLLP